MGSLLGLMLCIFLLIIKGCGEGAKDVYRRNYDSRHNYNHYRQSQVETDIICNPKKYEEKLGHPIDRTKPVYYKKAAAEVLAREGISYDNGSRYQDPEYMRRAHGVRK